VLRLVEFLGYSSLAVLMLAVPASAQQTRDTSHAYPWRGRVLYGVDLRRRAAFDFTGETPPAQWCLQATRRASGDLGVSQQSWTEVSRSWLHQVLSDTTDLGVGWRKVPWKRRASPHVIVSSRCSTSARVMRSRRSSTAGCWGWEKGPPPVVVFRVRDYLIAYPSNARMREFGLAFGLSLERQIPRVHLVGWPPVGARAA